MSYIEVQSRNKKIEAYNNLQNLSNSIPRHEKLIGQGVAIGLSFTSPYTTIGKIGNASKLITTSKQFLTGFGMNSAVQIIINQGFSRVDWIDAVSSGITSTVTKNYNINIFSDALLSSTMDYTYEGGFQSTFDGSKNLWNTGVDLTLGVGVGFASKGTDYLFDANNTRSMFKPLSPAVKKSIANFLKISENAAGSAAGSEVKKED